MVVWNPWKPVPPWWLAAFFAALALGAYGFSLPETVTIYLAIACFAAVTVLHPLNGVSFLLLVTPFFLGNPYKPYQFLLEIFIYGTLLAMVLRRPWERPGVPFPLKIPVLIFLLSALVSLPLNSRELAYTVWALPLRDLFFQWLQGNPGAPVHGLRVLTNLGSAAALCYCTSRAVNTEHAGEAFLVGQSKALVLMASLVAGMGFLFLLGWLPRGRTYASLSLVGSHEGAISAFAFNRQFLGQYFLLCLPFAFYLTRKYLAQREVLRLVTSTGAIALLVFALAASISRSVYIVLALQTGFILIVGGWLLQAGKKWRLLFALSPLLIAAVILLLDWGFFHQLFLRRLQYLEQVRDIRPVLWHTAWAMFRVSPWLGVGLGKYYYFFPEFFPGPPGAWQAFNANRGNAHAVVVQLLAEQGLFGCLAFFFLAAMVLIVATRGLIRESRTDLKALRLTLFTAAATWLVLGLFHHIAYDLRSLEIFFWIVAAFLLALAPGGPFPFRPGRKTWAFFLGLLALALGFQGQAIRSYPLPENFQVGFFQWEEGPQGNPVRWMGQRAIARLPAGRGDLLIECRAPLPGVDRKPQRLSVQVGDRRQRFTLEDQGWKLLTVSVPEPRGSHVLLRLETGHTFNPARAGISRDRRDLGLQLREFRWAP